MLTRTVADSCSLSETWRVLVAAPSGAIAGRPSWLGGVLGSGAVAGTTRKRITCPVVSGSAGSKSTPGLAAAERLVGGEVLQDDLGSGAGRS